MKYVSQSKVFAPNVLWPVGKYLIFIILWKMSEVYAWNKRKNVCTWNERSTGKLLTSVLTVSWGSAFAAQHLLLLDVLLWRYWFSYKMLAEQRILFLPWIHLFASLLAVCWKLLYSHVNFMYLGRNKNRVCVRSRLGRSLPCWHSGMVSRLLIPPHWSPGGMS